MASAVIAGQEVKKFVSQEDCEAPEAGKPDLRLVSFSRREIGPALLGAEIGQTIDSVPVAAFPFYQGPWLRCVMFECAERRFIRYGLENDARETIERELRAVNEARPIRRICAGHIRVDDDGMLAVRHDVIGYATSIQLRSTLAQAFPSLRIELEPTEALRRCRV